MATTEQQALVQQADIDQHFVEMAGAVTVVSLKAQGSGKDSMKAFKSADGAAHVAYLNRMGTLDRAVVKELESKLDKSGQVLRSLGKSMLPWSRSRNMRRAQEAADELESEKATLRTLLEQAMLHMDALEAEAASARAQLAAHDAVVQQVQQLQNIITERDEEIAKLNATISELKGKKQEQAALQQSLLTKVEEAAGHKRYLKLNNEAAEAQLQAKVEQLLKEHTALQAENDKLSKSKADLAKKCKELQDKVRDEVEVREREVKRLTAELRKSNEVRDAEVASVKEAAKEEVASKSKDLKALKTRSDLLKSDNESLKEKEKTLKAQLEQATAQLSKAQEDLKAAARKASDSKLARDDTAREAELAKAELSMLHGEYTALMKEAKTAATALASKFYNKDAPWPRYCFTTKGGKCLHNRACGSIDVSKVNPVEYTSHKELEQMIVEQGVVLCRNCRADGF